MSDTSLVSIKLHPPIDIGLVHFWIASSMKINIRRLVRKKIQLIHDKIIIMEIFPTLRDSDIFEHPSPEPSEYISRPTVKGIVRDESGNIALLRNPHYSLFPGGVIEPGETPEDAFVRECKEEIGCTVHILSVLGNAVQFRARNNQKYEVTFFIAEVVGEKGQPTTTQEDEQGVIIDWLREEKLLETLEAQLRTSDDRSYTAHFNIPLHLSTFQKFLTEKSR